MKRVLIGLTFFLLPTICLAGSIRMDAVVDDLTARNIPTDGSPLPIVFETTFDSGFQQFDVTAKNISPNILSTFPEFSGTRDLMQQADKISFTDDTNDMLLSIISPDNDLSQLDFDNFQTWVDNGTLLLNYRWYDPAYSFNFDAWYEASVMEPKIENIQQVVPEPSAIVLVLMGLVLVLRRRHNDQAGGSCRTGLLHSV